MDEYIKRSDAVQCARDIANDFKNDGFVAEAGGADAVGDWLQDFPTADVQPVIHSFWGYNPGDNIPYCDNCGMPQDARSDFCHCCGADMRPTSVSGAKELSKPRWIPVTEALPKTGESILGKKSSKVIVAFRFDDGTQGTDTAHTLNGEWVFEDHITVVARTITHWMPLPEPPKEE